MIWHCVETSGNDVELRETNILAVVKNQQSVVQQVTGAVPVVFQHGCVSCKNDGY